MHTQLRGKVLLCAGDIDALIGERSAHRLLLVHTLSLELHGLIIDPRLLFVRQVSESRLKARLGTQLLLLESCLQVRLPCGHPRCAVTLELLLRLLKRSLHTPCTDIAHLLSEVLFPLHGSKKLTATTVGALTGSAEVLGNLRTARIRYSTAKLRLQRLLKERRHVTLNLLATEHLRASHTELFQRLLAEASLRRLHLRSAHHLGRDFPHITHLERIEVGPKARLRTLHGRSTYRLRTDVTGGAHLERSEGRLKLRLCSSHLGGNRTGTAGLRGYTTHLRGSLRRLLAIRTGRGRCANRCPAILLGSHLYSTLEFFRRLLLLSGESTVSGHTTVYRNHRATVRRCLLRVPRAC